MTNIYPVIHVLDLEQVLSEIRKIADLGINGVFLVNHDEDWKHLRQIFTTAAAEFPFLWMGINCLDLVDHEVFEVFPEANAIWIDDAGVNSKGMPTSKADKLWEAAQSFGGTYFGGVAFKYQIHVSDLSFAAAQSPSYMDVVTTSGDATGKAPSLDKIQQMKEAMGTNQLAIASGITPDNVTRFLPYVDHILVSTGISEGFHSFDPVEVERLIKVVHGFANQ